MLIFFQCRKSCDDREAYRLGSNHSEVRKTFKGTLLPQKECLKKINFFTSFSRMHTLWSRAFASVRTLSAPELAAILDQDPTKVWTPDQVLTIAFKHPPYFPPGTAFHYDSTNYALLGLIA
jgi:hypothetical protein